MSDAATEDGRGELRASVRQCLARHTDLRAHLADPVERHATVDTGLWQRLAGQMGVAGLVVPERCGGSGATMADLAVVFEEFGAALAPVPLLGTAGLALPALLCHGRDPAAEELLEGIAAGELTATVAFSEPDGSYDPESTSVTASRDGDGWSLRGSKDFVVDLAASDVVLVPARTEHGVGLFAVRSTQAGVEVTPRGSLDLLHGMARLELRQAPARRIGADSAPWRLRAALDQSCVLLSAEQVGGAQRCLDNAVAYAKERVQFDRPIGSFQAIKHQLVDLLLEVELARSAMTHALSTSDEYLLDPAEPTARALAEAASLARSLCSETYSRVADEALHIHGGIGFTWEHDSHLYYRRAKFAELLYGNPDQHRNRLARLAGL